MRYLILATLVVFPLAGFASEPAVVPPALEYKGVRFGSTQAELIAAHPEFRCNVDRDYPEDSACSITPRCHYLSGSGKATCEREFSERHTYAGEPALMTMATFYQNRLVSVGAKFRPRSYDRIRDALATKYGAAEELADTVTTNAGVTHENRTASWRLPDGVIRLRRLSSRVDEGLVSLMSHGFLTLVQDRKKAKATTAPADL